MENKNDETWDKIADLRERYRRLKATCGLQAISKETIADYSKQLKELQAQLN